MKRKITPFIILISAILLCSSCLGDGTQYEYTDDTAITAFTLGTLKRTLTTKTSDNLNDSTYTTTLDCSDYKFYIDHLAGTIYNPDSLPAGMDATRVPCTISTRNSGIVVLKSMISDSLSYYSSSDSLNFSEPRIAYVYSNSGNSNRKYTITLNIHKEDGDEFVWKSLASNIEALGVSSLSGLRLTSIGGNLLLGGTNGQNSTFYTSADGTTWAETTIADAANLSADAYLNVVKTADKAYFYDNGTVYATSNGTTWTSTPCSGITRLVAAGSSTIYAYAADGGILASENGGATWTSEELDESTSALPAKDLSYARISLKTNDDSERILLMGNLADNVQANDTTAVVWGKVKENNDNAQNQSWSLYSASPDNRHLAPALNNLQIATYNGGFIAIGGKNIYNADSKPMTTVYSSFDQGITWYSDTTVTIPSGLKASEVFAFTTDSNNFVWIVSGNQVWRGRLNSLGWAKRDTAFVKEEN